MANIMHPNRVVPASTTATTTTFKLNARTLLAAVVGLTLLGGVAEAAIGVRSGKSLCQPIDVNFCQVSRLFY